MPRKSNEARLAEIHAIALEQFDDAFSATRADRERSRDERRFVDIRGAQWDWDAENQFSSRMKLEINELALACVRITNEYRQNEIEAQFIPKDGEESDALADLCASRYRADWQDSGGKEARDNCFDEMIKGGMGAYRFRAEYENGKDGKQRICVEPIHDAALSVYFDANAKRKDGRDADHAFLIRPYSRRAYERLWNDVDAAFPAGLPAPKFDWIGPEQVYVAEYFVKETIRGTKRVFRPITGDDEEFMPGELDEQDVQDLIDTGYTEQEPEQVDIQQVRKYTLSGSKVLSDDGIIAGKHIPIVAGYAHYTVIDGVPRFRSHATMALDPSIVNNIQFSKIAEVAASSSIRKPIFMPGQVEGHSHRWDNDHVDNNAYLLLNPIVDAVSGQSIVSGPVGYTEPPNIPDAVAALLQISRETLNSILGNPGAGEVIQPNTPGIAMELAQARMDMQTSGYIDNLADGERRAAEIWLSMAKDVYVEADRKLKTMSKDGRRGSVVIGGKVFDEARAITREELTFDAAEFDVAVTTGPSSASKRMATARTLMAILQYVSDPQTVVEIVATVMLNLEGNGLGDLRKSARKKLVSLGVIEPSKEEQLAAAKDAESAAPDQQAALAAALAEEAKSKATLAQANAGKALADTEKAKAQTAEIVAGISRDDRKTALETANAITEGLKPNGA